VERDALLAVAVATTVATAWRAAARRPPWVVVAVAAAALVEFGVAAFAPWPAWTRGPLALHATSLVGKLAALGRGGRGATTPTEPPTRLLLYAFLWPGLELSIAFRRDARADRPHGRHALAVGLVEVALGWGIAQGARALGGFEAPEPIPSWLRCASFVAVLDGAFRASAGALRALGCHAEDLFREPWAAKDLPEFWGTRWNRFVGRTLALEVYAPVKARTGRALAVVAAFFMSGVFHEVLYGLPAFADGRYVAFFLAHGVATLSVGALVAGRRGRRPGLARRATARALSWAVLLATAPLFFGGPYSAVLPIERARP